MATNVEVIEILSDTDSDSDIIIISETKPAKRKKSSSPARSPGKKQSKIDDEATKKQLEALQAQIKRLEQDKKKQEEEAKKKDELIRQAELQARLQLVVPPPQSSPGKKPECCICMDTITTFANLSVCRHVFCHQCITDWITKCGKNAACPQCNKKCKLNNIQRLYIS